MKRVLVNIIIDTLAAMVMLGLLATGIILRFTLPPRSGRVRTLWSMSRHQWGDLHFWLALAAVAIVLLHLALHWDWVVCIVRRWLVGVNQGGPSKRLRVFSAIITALIVASAITSFWWISTRSVKPAGMIQSGGNGFSSSGSNLPGSMTLVRTAATLHCSIAEVKHRLGLASTTPESERLGQIARERGVTMREIRNRLELQSRHTQP